MSLYKVKILKWLAVIPVGNKFNSELSSVNLKKNNQNQIHRLNFSQFYNCESGGKKYKFFEKLCEHSIIHYYLFILCLNYQN